jgi:hypothetical protein
MRVTSYGAVVFAAVLTSSAAPAQQPSAQPCHGPEFRTLDFWVGDWIAYQSDGKRIGTNRITRDEYGDCVITEHFKADDGSLIGHSVSMYRPGLKQWRQNWVDNQGGYFDLAGGPVTGETYVFQLENKRVNDTQPYQRMIWQDIKPDGFTWRWQKRDKPGAKWEDSWVILYKKA